MVFQPAVGHFPPARLGGDHRGFFRKELGRPPKREGEGFQRNGNWRSFQGDILSIVLVSDFVLRISDLGILFFPDRLPEQSLRGPDNDHRQ